MTVGSTKDGRSLLALVIKLIRRVPPRYRRNWRAADFRALSD